MRKNRCNDKDKNIYLLGNLSSNPNLPISESFVNKYSSLID